MPEQRILHPDWRSYYEPTPYPFGSWATLRSTDSTVFFANETFLDASLYPLGRTGPLRLSQVVGSQQTVTLYIGDDKLPRLCHGRFSLDAIPNDVLIQDSYGRPAGILVSETARLAIFQTWPTGTYSFSFAQTGFCTDVCLPIRNDVLQGFLLEDGSVLAGDVWMLGADGIVLSPVVTAADTENDIEALTAIRVDVVGDPLFRLRLCASNTTPPNFLRTITFRRGCESVVCQADEFGEIKMIAGRADEQSTILRIRSIDGSLVVETTGDTT